MPLQGQVERMIGSMIFQGGRIRGESLSGREQRKGWEGP
jgi:hypothetical protein